MLHPSRRVLLRGALGAGAGVAIAGPSVANDPPRYGVRRLVDRPIIAPGMDARMGANIAGPSLIRAPDWLPSRLGAYYLYFSDHKGEYIRLAYADRLEGPWRVHAPGALQLSESGFPTERQAGSADAAPRGIGIPSPLDDMRLAHIASPDAHVDDARRRIVMYYHGLAAFGVQRTRAAVSEDGIRFAPVGGALGPAYMRVFRHDGAVYALAMPGLFLRSPDGFTPFEAGPRLFGPDQRHGAVLKRGRRLHVFWTRVGDAPERIYASTLDLAGDWMDWKASEPIEVLRPERPWEGAGLPRVPSVRSAINIPANQVRDPAVYEENGAVYLLYAVKGEAGIGIAELALPSP